MNNFDIEEKINVADFVKTVNKARLANKNNWYCFSGFVNGVEIKIKAYGTYLQIFKIDGVSSGGLCDISIKRFKEILTTSFNYHFKSE